MRVLAKGDGLPAHQGLTAIPALIANNGATLALLVIDQKNAHTGKSIS
jgi:hypothetical protein